MLEHAYVQRRPAHLNFQQRAGGCVHRGLGRDSPRRVERSRVGRQGVEIVPAFGATAPPVTPNGLCVRLNMCHKNQSGEKVSCYVRKKREHRGDQARALAKPHLDSLPAEDGQGEDDGGHAAVGDGDDHNRENFEVVRYVRSLDECVRGNVVKGANCVGRVGEESFAALSGPEVDVDVPANTFLKIST